MAKIVWQIGCALRDAAHARQLVDAKVQVAHERLAANEELVGLHEPRPDAQLAVTHRTHCELFGTRSHFKIVLNRRY